MEGYFSQNNSNNLVINVENGGAVNLDPSKLITQIQNPTSTQQVDLADLSDDAAPNGLIHVNATNTEITDSSGRVIDYNDIDSVYESAGGELFNVIQDGDYYVQRININGCTGYVESLQVAAAADVRQGLVTILPIYNRRPCVATQ